jgi:hypothetical protein
MALPNLVLRRTRPIFVPADHATAIYKAAEGVSKEGD